MHTRTLMSLFLAASLAACAGDEPAPVETDDGGGGGCPDNPTAPVPVDQRCLWEVNYEGCTTSQGRLGRKLFWRMEGQVDADGTITGNEKIWWFFPSEWNTDDCVDTLSLTGSRLSTDLERLGCGQCEEGYAAVREVTENSCNLGYNLLFEEDDEGLKQTLLFDTKTSNGEPNEDNNILILDRHEGKTEEYARGTMTPEGAEHGPPYSFTWQGEACLGR